MWFHKKQEDQENRPKPEPLDVKAAEEKIRGFIAKKSTVIKPADLNGDTKLFSSGLLDSLTFIQLVTFVETEFKIRLSDIMDVNAETMDSVDLIIQAVSRAHEQKT